MDVSFATMGAGTLHTGSLTQLLATLKTVCPAADAYSATPEPYAAAAAGSSTAGGARGPSPALGSTTSAGGSSGNVLSLAAHTKFVESFPGPLNSSSSKDKVVKFLKDRLAHYLQEECLTDAPSWQVDCRKVLWELLLLMAQHQGQLKVNYGSSSSNASKAAGLLRGAVTAAAGAAVTAATGGAAAAGSDTASNTGSAGTTPKAAAGAASAGGAAGGNASDAAAAADSELLKILLPGLTSSAASAAGGVHVVSHQVAEVELQATAAEMQVG